MHTTSTTGRKNFSSSFAAGSRYELRKELAKSVRARWSIFLCPEGAHAITKEDDEPVRYLMVSTLASPNVTEYPDTRQIAVTAATKNQFGEDLFDVLTLEPRKK